MVTCYAVGCYRLEQVVCVLQLTCVNCTRWTHAPVLCATACTVTCPTCGSTCASSTTLRVSHALYVTSPSRPSCTSNVTWSVSTNSVWRTGNARRKSTIIRLKFRFKDRVKHRFRVELRLKHRHKFRLKHRLKFRLKRKLRWITKCS